MQGSSKGLPPGQTRREKALKSGQTPALVEAVEGRLAAISPALSLARLRHHYDHCLTATTTTSTIGRARTILCGALASPPVLCPISILQHHAKFRSQYCMAANTAWQRLEDLAAEEETTAEQLQRDVWEEVADCEDCANAPPLPLGSVAPRGATLMGLPPPVSPIPLKSLAGLRAPSASDRSGSVRRSTSGRSGGGRSGSAWNFDPADLADMTTDELMRMCLHATSS